MQHDYFHHLPNLPLLPTAYIDIARRANYFFPEEHKLPSQITLGACVKFQSTKFIKDLAQQFPKVTVSFFRNEPRSFYDWHCDLGGEQHGARQCCINYVVSENPGAVTMFKDHSFNRMNHSIVLCDYTFLGATLFNTQRPHAVLNPTDEPRYILSVSFFQVDYAEVLAHLTKLDINSYD
jgi:hypothetical protein